MCRLIVALCLVLLSGCAVQIGKVQGQETEHICTQGVEQYNGWQFEMRVQDPLAALGALGIMKKE